MSYDFSIGQQDFNLTYNVAPMLYKAFGEGGLRSLYGMTGNKSFGKIMKALHYFKSHKDELEELNPENGWGSYETTLEVLSKMLPACIGNLDSVWEGD